MQSVQYHQDNCCVIHGCIDTAVTGKNVDEDCPVWNGAVRKNKKNPCTICEELNNANHLMSYGVYIHNYKSIKPFYKLRNLRSWITEHFLTGFIAKKHFVPPDQQDKVIEYKLVPVRTVSLERYIKEYEIFKKFK